MIYRTPALIVRCGRLLLAAALVAALTAGCEQKEPRIAIEHPYAALSEALYGAGAVYMRINNAGGRDTLRSVTVHYPGAIAEMHDIDGKRMFKVDHFDVPSRGTLELKPYDRHLMLFNMPKTVGAGSPVTLTLVFERSGERTITLRFVREASLPKDR